MVPSNPAGRAPSNRAEPLLAFLPQRPGPEAQPEAEHQLRGSSSRRAGCPCTCDTRRTDEPLLDVRRWGQQQLVAAAPRLGGLQGSRGQPLASTGGAKAHMACRPQRGAVHHWGEDTPFTSAAFRATGNVCAFIKVP